MSAQLKSTGEKLKLSKAVAEAKLPDGTPVEIDFTHMQDHILNTMDQRLRESFEKYLQKAKEGKAENDRKGVVETYMPADRKAALIEEFKKGEKLDPRKISEQWTVTVPYQAQYETAGHLRDFVFVTEAIKGRAGDTVNIPYVKDLEFAHLTAGTGSMTITTGLVDVLTTTLHESGAYYDAYYSDIEKIDSNLLDELNRVMAHAAIRAEDYDLISLLGMGNGTTASFGTNGAAVVDTDFFIKCGDYALAGSTFNVAWIADAIGILLKKGKDVRPGECLLVLNPSAYATLLRKMVTTTSTMFGYAMPSIATKGLIEEILGVKIVVLGNRMYADFATGLAGDTTYEVNYLMRPKRALALAPKRDILIETDKIIASRTLRIAATHTYAVSPIDKYEVVPIWSGLPYDPS